MGTGNPQLLDVQRAGASESFAIDNRSSLELRFPYAELGSHGEGKKNPFAVSRALRLSCYLVVVRHRWLARGGSNADAHLYTSVNVCFVQFELQDRVHGSNAISTVSAYSICDTSQVILYWISCRWRVLLYTAASRSSNELLMLDIFVVYSIPLRCDAPHRSMKRLSSYTAHDVAAYGRFLRLICKFMSNVNQSLYDYLMNFHWCLENTVWVSGEQNS